MKAIIILSLLAFSLSTNPIFSHEFYDDLKEKAPFELYTPEENPFRDYTLEELKEMLLDPEEVKASDREYKKALEMEPERFTPFFPKNLRALPTSYDFRTAHKECVFPVRNQG
ncbi:MAG: hypothetical protein MJ252_30470 [archaeon]|nr:hypothetical protein [archaeon]